MFGLIKQIFVSTMMFFYCNLSSLNPLEYVSINNQECEVRPKIVNVNSNDPVFYPFSVKTSKCSGICNISMIPMQNCVFLMLLKTNIEVFNLMSRPNKIRHVKWYETCKCKCRLDARVSNNKQCWNKDKCKCECEELIDKGICDKGFIWNPSNCECEYDKSCDVGEYLDYANCKYRKKLVHKLVEECTANTDEVTITVMALFERRN